MAGPLEPAVVIGSEVPDAQAGEAIHAEEANELAETAQELRDRAHFNRFAKRYAKKDYVPSSSLARRYDVQSAVMPLVERTGPLGTVIEIGCGPGAVARYLEGAYETYIGVDYSEKIIAAGRILNGHNGRAHFVVGNAKSIPLPDQIGDAVILLGALHHMTQWDAVMDDLKRVAKPGAHLVMREPFSGNPVVQLLRFVRGLVDPGYSRDQHFFSREELVRLLKSHGFADIEDGYIGYFSTPLAEVILPLGLLATLMSRAAVSVDRWLDRHLPAPLRIMAWNIVIRARFPV